MLVHSYRFNHCGQKNTLLDDPIKKINNLVAKKGNYKTF